MSRGQPGLQSKTLSLKKKKNPENIKLFIFMQNTVWGAQSHLTQSSLLCEDECCHPRLTKGLGQVLVADACNPIYLGG
jgi:hypothetical protein